MALLIKWRIVKIRTKVGGAQQYGVRVTFHRTYQSIDWLQKYRDTPRHYGDAR